ncbi:MAG TPA: exopolysaccharide biosynthesis polyprenyl glycosylphosphotransferase, partial [Pirellulales bacterium]|nr:exopolysaccharide biosynthesis polyprenyl glycosylphosphotransferase [Pirellulales bacterium]
WYLGPFEDASQLAEERGVSWGVVAMVGRPPHQVRRVVDQCAGTIPHVIIIPDMRAFPLARFWDPRCDFAGLATLRLDDRLLAPVPRTYKRIMDVALASLAMILLSPLLLGVLVCIKLGSPGPALYSQERIGYHGRRFRAWKFRSMVTNADEVLRQYLSTDAELEQEWKLNHKLRYDPRVTALGRWLRKFSVDELPQLWNVIVGEMSLVGPRPIVEAEIEKYSQAFPIYLRVRPGLTGLWQVSGRNNTTYEERVHLDVQYVRDWSPWLDLDIMFKTLRVVLRCDGAY